MAVVVLLKLCDDGLLSDLMSIQLQVGLLHLRKATRSAWCRHFVVYDTKKCLLSL